MSHLVLNPPSLAAAPGQRVRVLAPLREEHGSMVILHPGWVGEVVRVLGWGPLALVKHPGGKKYWLFDTEIEEAAS